MPKYHVWQLRSGEGAILTRFSHVGPSSLGEALPELLKDRVLLAAGEGLPPAGPPGAEAVAEGLWALRGEAASRFLVGLEGEGRKARIWAVVDEVPAEDVRTRCIPDPLRPWDQERLGAQAYGQSGRPFAHRGVWFRDGEQRRRWLEHAVGRILADAGHALPNGDVGIVLEMPGDATFEAELVARGRGDSFRLRRDFGNQGFVREWWIERGEWKGEETRRPGRENASLRQRCVQGLATAGIFLLSLPVSAFVFVVLLTTRLTDVSSTSSRAPGGR